MTKDGGGTTMNRFRKWLYKPKVSDHGGGRCHFCPVPVFGMANRRFGYGSVQCQPSAEAKPVVQLSQQVLLCYCRRFCFGFWSLRLVK